MAAEKDKSDDFYKSNNDAGAQWFVATNSQTKGDVLENIAQNAPLALLERIAEHPNAPQDLLRRLAAHPRPEIRSAVTDNPYAPEEIILMLCLDRHPDVRFCIAENHNMSPETLKLLIYDDNPYVAQRALKTLNRMDIQPGDAPGHFHDIEPKQSNPKAINVRKKLKVLVIEDNPADMKLLRKMLAEWPYELECANRLSKGMEYLDQSTVDVILLDLSLPDAQGIETFYQLHCHAPNIPIVVLTGLEDESVGTEAVQSGAQDYLVKGQVLPGLLGRSIKYAIERHQTETKMNQLNKSLEQRVIQLATANQELDKLGKSLALSCEQLLQSPNLKSRVEAEKFKLENVEFCPVTLLEDIAELFAASAAKKGVSVMTYIDAALQPVLQGDPARLREILINLTNNAIKFTPHGEVVLRATKESEDDGYVTARFSVTDTGIGMPEAVSSHLFEPVVQSDIPHKCKGSELSLSICKRIVELMGGHIGVESKEGKGSTLWFSVRLKRSDTLQFKMGGGVVLHTLSAYQSNVRVLVAARNSTTRDLLQHYIHAAGWRSNGTAVTAEEAISMLHHAETNNDPYNVAIIDLESCSPDSFELAAMIQEDPTISATRLIFLTDIHKRQRGEQAWSAGFSAYLTKPIKQWNLLDCIAKVADSSNRQVNTNPIGSAWSLGSNKL